MSKYVDEIVKDIKDFSETWKAGRNNGLEKDDIIIFNCGNPRFISSILVKIKDIYVPLSYIDRWKLEIVVKWWYANIPLKIISL